jgi:LSD1 subclass zinc finger protein
VHAWRGRGRAAAGAQGVRARRGGGGAGTVGVAQRAAHRFPAIKAVAPAPSGTTKASGLPKSSVPELVAWMGLASQTGLGGLRDAAAALLAQKVSAAHAANAARARTAACTSCSRIHRYSSGAAAVRCADCEEYLDLSTTQRFAWAKEEATKASMHAGIERMGRQDAAAPLCRLLRI